MTSTHPHSSENSMASQDISASDTPTAKTDDGKTSAVEIAELPHTLSGYWKQHRRAMGAIVLLGLTLRLVGIGWRSFHPDESNIVKIPIKMLKYGTLEPDKMNYGTLPLYIHALLLQIIQWFEQLAGFPGTPKAGQGVVVGRILSTLTSTLTILVTSAITFNLLRTSSAQNESIRADLTQRIQSPPAQPTHPEDNTQARTMSAYVAGLAFALSFLSVQCSHYSTVDSMVALLVSLSMFYTIRAYDSRALRDIVLAGVFAGLSTASKYTGGLVALPLALLPMAVIGLDSARKRQLWRNTLLGLLAVPVTFVCAMPYAVLRYDKLIDAIRFESRHYQTGGETIFAMGDHTWLWNLQFIYHSALGPGLSLICLFGILISLKAGTVPTESRRKTLLLLLYVGIAFAFLSRYKVRFDRNILPFLPLLCVLVGVWCHRILVLGDSIAKWRWIGILTWLGLGLAMLYPLSRDIIFDWQLYQPHTKLQYRQWKEMNLAGARVAEHGRKQNAPLEAYQRRGFEYLIVSSHSLEPIAAQPDEFPLLYQFYQGFFAGCEIVKVFRNPWFESDFFAPHSLLNSATVNPYHGPTIWVLKIPPPSSSAATRGATTGSGAQEAPIPATTDTNGPPRMTGASNAQNNESSETDDTPDD